MALTDNHYATIASSYDDLWSYSEDYLHEMTCNIVDVLEIRSEHRIADVGGGTGLYAKQLIDVVDPIEPITVVDPSTRMLEGLEKESMLRPVHHNAMSFAKAVGVGFDRLLLKEVVHHFDDLTGTLIALRARLSSTGRMLVIMLPPTIDYPIFQTALLRYEELQPHYDHVARAMEDAGLEVKVEQRTIVYEIERERYLEMTRRRYMSVLSEFSDDELEAGIEEMQAVITADPVTIPDTFVYVVGRVPR